MIPLLASRHVWSTFRLRELRQNQRQRGDVAWATLLNALRDCADPTAVEAAIAALTARVATTADQGDRP